MESKVYNQKGEESGTITLPESVFGLPWNGDLVHQVAEGMMSNARIPYAHSKTRGEVRGGGKKPWQQKGTGRARHGSTRSPIWVGGGVTHGPRNDKNFDKKINKKMRVKALFTILSKKQKEGEILFVNEIQLPQMKTKQAYEVVQALGTVSGFERMPKKPTNAIYLALPAKELSAVKRGFNNMGNIEVDSIENLNPLLLLKYKYFVMTHPEQSIKYIAGKIEKKKAKVSKVSTKK